MQAMSGKGSAPLARGNAPVSIFKNESKAPLGADTVKPKAPKTAKQTEENRTRSRAGGPSARPQFRTADAYDAVARPRGAPGTAQGAGRAAEGAAGVGEGGEGCPAQSRQDPKEPRDRLAEVIARQADTMNKWLPLNLAQRVRARVKAGQDQATATEQVMAFVLGKVEAELAKLPATADHE